MSETEVGMFVEERFLISMSMKASVTVFVLIAPPPPPPPPHTHTQKSKVLFIILSPSAIEASHNGFMRQFELYVIITPTYSTHVRSCMPGEW